MKQSRRKPSPALQVRIALLAAICAVVGCRSERNESPTTQPARTEITVESPAAKLARGCAEARQENKPLLVLVYDPHRDVNESARIGGAMNLVGGVVPMTAGDKALIAVVLPLSDSQSRAAAAPLHGLDAVTLAVLTPQGIGVSHDEGEAADQNLLDRITAAIDQSPAIDAEYSKLRAADDQNPATMSARMALANFLLDHKNDQQAIPLLKAVADDTTADPATRIDAWTKLARAHLWVIEPEKARYTAQALIDTLGPQYPDAIAGGNLVRGLQDTRAKRFDRARTELTTAIHASPDSAYGREAASVLATLPKDK